MPQVRATRIRRSTGAMLGPESPGGTGVSELSGCRKRGMAGTGSESL